MTFVPKPTYDVNISATIYDITVYDSDINELVIYNPIYTWTFQDDENSSSSCLYYNCCFMDWENAIDDDWDTKSSSVWIYDESCADTFNYAKPINFTSNSVLRYKYYGPSEIDYDINISIPLDCFNNTELEFAVVNFWWSDDWSDVGIGGSSDSSNCGLYCKGITNVWHHLNNNNSSIYDFGMWWEIEE
jgi:hypothetical protein